MKSRKKFMRFYDESVDDVFLFYYEKTHNREKSLELTRGVFEKTWDSMRHNSVSIITNEEKAHKGTNTSVPKSDSFTSFGFKHNQYGY